MLKFTHPTEPPTISVEEFENYLSILILGKKSTLSNSKKLWKAIGTECKSRNVHKILIENRVEISLSQVEMYQLMAELPKFGFLDVIIAYVDIKLSNTDLNNFAGVVASNRGIYGQYFNDPEKALVWLNSHK